MKVNVETKKIFGNTTEVNTFYGDDKDTDIHTRMRYELARKIINLEEKSIREALIKLGWTPPKEDNFHPNHEGE